MIEANPRGGLMVIAGLVSGFVVGGVASLMARNESLPIAVASLVALPLPTGLDLWYRRGHHRHLGWWRYVVPEAGGSFMFLPVWVWFGAVPVVGNVVWHVGRAGGLA
jgi:hypothetical protein